MRAPTQGRTDRGTAAVELLGALYPPPLRVRVAVAGGDDVRAAWTAVPSTSSPRLLLPAVGGAAASRAVRRQLTGHRMRTRVARTGLSLAAGSGALARVPQLRVVVEGPADAPSIEDPLRAALGVEELRLTMPIGPARSNRKPVLQVTDTAGDVLAFAKVGHNPLTRLLVQQEGVTLGCLARVPLQVVRTPRVLATETWAGFEVLVLEPLDVPARRLTGDPGRRRLVEVVREVAAIGGRTLVDWRTHPYRTELLARIERCGDLAVPLRRELERTVARLPVATGCWHGDLNSGNVALLPGECPVWDWERFETGVPVGFDLLHHDLHEAITVHGVAPEDAARRLVGTAARTLAPLGVLPATADAVARAYLVTLACRYLVDNQSAAGASLGRVQEWLLPTLEEVRP
ncbi:hypothetical protein ACT8ZV_03205 [Nocardioides sp. MAHUQ-72]|uniref:hypothetical protein n=1 Tax=unclassified Nocardioides TaxID=2615069 RepID=UPI00361B7C6F